MIFNLDSLTPRQREITLDAISRVQGFNWDRLAPQLQSEVGKTQIPVEWADLSQYLKAAVEMTGHEHTHKRTRGVVEHSHLAHVHIQVGSDRAHGIVFEGFRERVLGLAWYSGRISIDTSLESDPDLAVEVFLSEGAHMVDFFLMSDEQRTAIFQAFHPGGVELNHPHQWFDNPSYWDDVGEAFMGGFIAAFAPSVPVTLTSFTHPATPEAGQRIREILAEPQRPFFSTRSGSTFHDSHRGLQRVLEFASYQEAVDAGKRPCKTCKPKP